MFLSENERNNFDKLDKITKSLNQTEGYITLSVIIDDSKHVVFKLLKNLNDILQKIIEYEIHEC